MEKLAVSIADAAEMIGISKSQMYKIINSEECDFAFELGGRRLIAVSKFKDWIAKKCIQNGGKSDE